MIDISIPSFIVLLICWSNIYLSYFFNLANIRIKADIAMHPEAISLETLPIASFWAERQLYFFKTFGHCAIHQLAF